MVSTGEDVCNITLSIFYKKSLKETSKLKNQEIHFIHFRNLKDKGPKLDSKLRFLIKNTECITTTLLRESSANIDIIYLQ